MCWSLSCDHRLDYDDEQNLHNLRENTFFRGQTSRNEPFSRLQFGFGDNLLRRDNPEQVEGGKILHTGQMRYICIRSPLMDLDLGGKIGLLTCTVLAHVAHEPWYIAYVFWVGSVLHRCCAACDDGI